MSDALAAAFGFKVYDSISVTGTASWSTESSQLIPKQMQDGTWRLKFNIVGTTTSSASVDVSITGVLFKNTASARHWAVAVGSNSSSTGNVTVGFATENSNLIELGSATNRTIWQVSGDLPLESKPSWAD